MPSSAAAAAHAFASISGVMSIRVTLPFGPTSCAATSESLASARAEIEDELARLGAPGENRLATPANDCAALSATRASSARIAEV